MIYEGREDYIFISYSHKDSQKVLPIIDLMHERGFRVWYDAGIEAGTEWPAYIEEHLNNASVVLAFMTPNAIESKHCRNEINFAVGLNKEVLIVYLEDTTLVKGMRLQLHSTQSLFRSNHPTNESFVRELLNARILRNCREDSGAEKTPEKSEEITPQDVTRISNICSIGANDENDLWPKGKYSQTINRDEHRVVFFHINLLRPVGISGQIKNDYQIFNSENNLVFEDDTSLEVEKDYDRISMGWILKGDDGSFVPSGDYRFVCSVNGSPSFTYFFTVCSDDDKPRKNPSEKSFLGKIKKILE